MLKRKDLIHPQLSYVIIGVLFDVYNNLGPGHKEKYYQKAIAMALKTAGISFKEQAAVPLLFKLKEVGLYYLDFLIEDKIILEIKAGDKFLKQNIAQVYGYLKAKKLQLGILANFTKAGLQSKRIVNIK